MPDTTIVGGLVAAVVLLIVVVALSRRKKAPAAEQPREIAPPVQAAPSLKPPVAAPPPASLAPSAPPPAEPEFPAPTAVVAEETPFVPIAPPPEARKQDDVELASDAALGRAATEPPTAIATVPPPSSAEPSSGRAPRPKMPSYSNISDESVAEEIRHSQVPEEVSVDDAEPVEPLAPPPVIKPSPRPVAPTFSRPAAPPAPRPAAPIAAPPEPKAAAPAPAPAPSPKPAPSEPKVASSPLQATAKVAPATLLGSVARENEVAAPKPSPTAAAARFLPPSNPATADLEKNDPRHAAARRLARLSVSEIKLYHETEVKEGREAKDLWKRLNKDISLARQTFDGRTPAEVRERFDYLYDEILRQLAEGDAAKLGPEAPAPKNDAAAVATPVAPAAAPAEAPPADVDFDAPTRTARRTLEPSAPEEVTKPEPVAAPVIAKPAPAPVSAPAASVPATVSAPAASAPAAASATAPAAAPKPTGLAARLAPSNPETAELEKNDPRHAAARRLARLSVSEIKLYHETEVAEGREAKDLWKRLNKDISLARQTFDNRTAADVRERFDYLYDEIVRQLAEGDAAKLGPDAPKPATAAAAPAPAAPAPSEPKVAPAPVPSEPKVSAAPAPASTPKPMPSEPKIAPAPAPVAAAPKPAPSEPKVAPAAAPAAAASPTARFLPPSNPATAELEKSDPRHAAARRLARLSVSEIKLYHETEVKEGREAKDLWKRLNKDISLARQTFDGRTAADVRERFDYLYDEILRQLAEGDAAKLGAEAPKPKVDA